MGVGKIFLICRGLGSASISQACLRFKQFKQTIVFNFSQPMITPAVKIHQLKSAFVLLLAVGGLFPCVSLAESSQPISLIAQSSQSVDASTRPNSLTKSVFSIEGGERLTAEAMSAVNQQNYDLAVTKLQDARQVYNQLSNFYQELTSSFSGIDNRISESHRQKALQAAQLRDKTTYQLAVVYRAKNQPELAVPLLVQLIRSQQPTRELGQQAYQQLYEIGFVDMAYPQNPSSATPATP